MRGEWCTDADGPLPVPFGPSKRVSLHTCVECGRRWASPPNPVGGCDCGGTVVCHYFAPGQYARLRHDGSIPADDVADRRLITDGGVDDVTHTVTDRPVTELSKAALKAEWSEASEQLRGPMSDERRETVRDRRIHLWNEMRDRTDAEPPECPECGGQGWSQTMGDPKHCTSCGLELGPRHEDLVEQIDAYWRSVKAVDDHEDLLTDGGVGIEEYRLTGLRSPRHILQPDNTPMCGIDLPDDHKRLIASCDGENGLERLASFFDDEYDYLNVSHLCGNCREAYLAQFEDTVVHDAWKKREEAMKP